MKSWLNKVFGIHNANPKPVAREVDKRDPLPMPHSAQIKPGDFIGGEYRVRRIFGGEGRSGMGVVYLVEGRTSEVPFVLKTFQTKRASAASIARFKMEAETWVNLGKHPNIVHCQWVSQFSEQLFVAAEYIWPDAAGRNTLTQHIAAGCLSLSQQLKWIAEFCYGMKHAMAHGMRAHRDVKPDNLMVDNRGNLKITDFGLVRGLYLIDEKNEGQTIWAEDDKVTAAGTALGTPPFMSPEQFLDSSTVDHRSDIYSLGVVIYMMISGGKMPIMPHGRGDDYFREWASAHRQQRIVTLDHPLMGLAEKCLEKDGARRFQTYDEILEAVGDVCRTHGRSIPKDELDVRAEFLRQWSLAMTLVNLERPEEAICKLREMEALWPESPEVHSELGRAYYKLGKCDQALAETETALKLDPCSTADWNNLGGLFANSGRHDEAKRAYLNALKIEPENTGAMVGLVQLLMTEREMSEAVKWCEVALFWRPEKIIVLQIAADCFAMCGDSGRAVELLERLLAINPDDAIAWYKKGNIMSSLGRYDEAIACYDRAIETAPRTVDVWKSRGGSINGVIGAVRADKVEAEAWNSKGLVLKASGRFTEALVCYERTLAVDSRRADVWCNKGAVFHGQGRPDEALSCFETATTLDPQDLKAWCNRGVALRAIGRVEEAIACYEKALQVDPQDIKTWFNKGNAYAEMKCYQDALVCFQEAQKLGDPSAGRYVDQCRRLIG